MQLKRKVYCSYEKKQLESREEGKEEKEKRIVRWREHGWGKSGQEEEEEEEEEKEEAVNAKINVFYFPVLRLEPKRSCDIYIYIYIEREREREI